MSDDPWEGLRLETEFQPRIMEWNGTPFSIDVPAVCYKGYDLDQVSLEDYYPDLRTDPTYYKELPWDEIKDLRVLHLIGLDKTIYIHVMLKESVPAYPEALFSSGVDDGWHAGGAVVVGGNRTPIKGIRVEPTDPAIRGAIDAAKRARNPVPGVMPASRAQNGGTPALSQVIPEATDLDYRRLAQVPDQLLDLKRDLADVRAEIHAVAVSSSELQQENAWLKDLVQGGFLKFATRVDADSFRAFAAIMLTGNRNLAAEALQIPGRTFYDLVESWQSKGPDYRRMLKMIEWRKRQGRMIKVRMEESLLGTEVEGQPENPETIQAVLAKMREKKSELTGEELLKDILGALERQNPENWRVVNKELVSLIREDITPP